MPTRLLLTTARGYLPALQRAPASERQTPASTRSVVYRRWCFRGAVSWGCIRLESAARYVGSGSSAAGSTASSRAQATCSSNAAAPPDG